MNSSTSMKQTRHVLRLMGRRMTTVYGSRQILEQTTAGARLFTSNSNDFHNKSSLIMTSKKKDGEDPPGAGSGHRNTTTSSPPTTTTTTGTTNRDVPRRIVVKAAGDSNKQLKQKQRVGVLKRRFPLHNESK